eukprot:Clim_evm9s136 gene=Clim_evmTU9s136
MWASTSSESTHFRIATVLGRLIDRDIIDPLRCFLNSVEETLDPYYDVHLLALTNRLIEQIQNLRHQGLSALSLGERNRGFDYWGDYLLWQRKSFGVRVHEMPVKKGEQEQLRVEKTSGEVACQKNSLIHFN